MVEKMNMQNDDPLVTVNIRVRKSLKENFEKVIEGHEINLTQSVTGLFEVTVRNGTLPFKPVTDFYTPKEYFETATEKAEELVLMLNAAMSGEEISHATTSVALNALGKTAHYINAHLEEMNRFEHGQLRSEGMTFYVANMTWSNLLREIGQAEYNLRVAEEFDVRRKELSDNVESIRYLCGVLRRYLSGEKPRTITWSEAMTSGPVAPQPVKQDSASVLASLQYEAGAASFSLTLPDPKPGDVLEYIGPGTPFRLFIYGPDAAAREELTRSLMASPLGTTSVLLAGSGPQDAADAWRAYTEGKGAIVDVNAPDFKGMMEKLYGSITPLIEEPPEANLPATGDAEAWAAAVSGTMRQPGQRLVLGGPGKKP